MPCGPGKFGDWFVPDRFIGGVDLSEACSIHDRDYATPDKPKSMADREFYGRIKGEVDRERTGLGWVSGRIVAWAYYVGVKVLGGRAYKRAQRRET